MKNILLILLFLWTTNSLSQSYNTQKLDSLLTILENNDKFMGSIAVSKDHKVIYQKAIGYADIEDNIKATTATKYRIGSISKMFTAALVMKAIEDGKLKLNQNLSDYFPLIQNADRITIKNLLNHSSGIYSITSDPKYLQWSIDEKTRLELLEKIIDGKPAFVPNEKSGYSNSNYILLTFLLEDIYGQSFASLIKDKIAEPLGLDDTYYGGSIDTENNESVSYKHLGKWKLEPKTNLSVPQGAGAIVSTPVDLNNFIEGLFLGKIVSKQTLKMMMVMEEGYGLGMFQFSYLEEPNYGHTGGIDGFRSLTVYFPEDSLSISMTSNALNYSQKDLTIAISNTFRNTSFEMPIFEELNKTSAELNQYLGTYSSTEIPPKFTVTIEGNTLIAQATGQPAFPLKEKSLNIFTYDNAGITLKFDPEKNTLIIKQGDGGEFLFSKD